MESQINCCRYRFRLQLFRRKEVILVLLYSLFANSAVHFVFFQQTGIAVYVISAVGACTFPIAGYLADVCIKRYKLIKISMMLIWLSSVIICAVSTVQYINGITITNSIHSTIVISLHVLLAIGLGGFLSNIVQFSMDQLRKPLPLKSPPL